MSFARRQRAALLKVMDEVGPLAETACEGWRTQDLAAHLYVREHKPAALPGIGSQRFAAKTQRIQMEALHSLGYAELLARLAAPSLLMRPLDPLVGALEWYIHHEDVLRPRGARVPLSAAEQRKLLPAVKALAWKTARGLDTRLVVSPTGLPPLAFGTGDRRILVEGEPGDLLLHFTGRRADVEIFAEDPARYLERLKGL